MTTEEQDNTTLHCEPPFYAIQRLYACAFEIGGIAGGAGAAIYIANNNKPMAVLAFIGGVAAYFTGKSLNSLIDAQEVKQALQSKPDLEERSESPDTQ